MKRILICLILSFLLVLSACSNTEKEESDEGNSSIITLSSDSSASSQQSSFSSPENSSESSNDSQKQEFSDSSMPEELTEESSEEELMEESDEEFEEGSEEVPEEGSDEESEDESEEVPEDEFDEESEEGSDEVPEEGSAEVSEGDPDDSFELPNFVGSRFELANDEASAMRLWVTVKTASDDHYETGVVMAQDPESGSLVRPGDTLTLYVSLGPAQTFSTVPDLFGLTKDEAQARLTEEGLVLGLVSEDYSNSVQEGKVISQGTEEGTVVAKGTSIDITISKGPREISEKTNATGTVEISQPFTKAEQNGLLIVIAYDADGNASTIYENTVSYSTFSSLGGVIKVNYPAGTQLVEAYLNDILLLSENIN